MRLSVGSPTSVLHHFGVACIINCGISMMLVCQLVVVSVICVPISPSPNFCNLNSFLQLLHEAKKRLLYLWQADQNRIRRKQLPLYGVEGRFERINQHPVMFLQFKIWCSTKCKLFEFYSNLILLQNAGTHSFSIGITEVLNTNLLIELTADDIEYVYQRFDIYTYF